MNTSGPDPSGGVPFHTHGDDDITEAIAAALGERKVRLSDRRLLLIYLFVVLLIVITTSYLGHNQRQANLDRREFEYAASKNCLANRQNTVNFNAFIDKLIASYRQSKLLTPQEKEERSRLFTGAKLEVPDCPPFSGAPK